MKLYQPQTLNEVIIQQQSAFPYAKGELSRLLSHLGVAAKIVHKKVNKAGLVDILGEAGQVNVQGEDQKKLDVFADETFINAFQTSGMVAGIATEEQDDIVIFRDELAINSNYIIFSVCYTVFF